ncbi:MAG: SDR family oxidoreductase [Sphingobacteriales bacterium]|nr:SDR family oxidoreductase [Sphingobacteriales bacterium]NCT77083.1 SDR family oxidoreductase [Chitinophagaceae bacterium]OJW33029.1 MAG: short-chain dehydrogenase [Sphingobacteriales bacterium 46-32]
MFKMTGKKAIVTGAGSGIGRAIAKLFAAQGAFVYVADISSQQADAVVASIKEEGGQAASMLCDVANQSAVKEAFAVATQIDILVNSAGISHIGRADNTTEEDFDRIYQVNVKGVYNCIQAALPAMIKSGGSIINLASVAGNVGLPDRFAYSMSKGAVIGMTLSVAKDYLAANIRCNCISPGRVHTPFVDNFLAKNYPGKEQEMFEKLAKTQPIGRMGKPEEIAALALYLASDEASFITGCDYPIDGGFIKLNN